MSQKVTPTTDLEQALLDDANDLLLALDRYAIEPNPSNWNRVEAARQSLSDTTFGSLRQ